MVYRLAASVGLRRWFVLALLGAGSGIGFPAREADAVSLSGTIMYSGSQGPVSDARPIVIRITDDPFFGTFLSEAPITAGGGAFTLEVPAAGQYYLFYWLDARNDRQISVGEPFEVYNDQFTFPGQPITVPQAGVVLDFNDNGVISGISGTATYTGSLGPVTETRSICVCAFADTELTNLLGCVVVTTNGGDYEAITLNTRTYYLMAFLDINNNIAIDPGEPFEIYNNRGAPPADPVVAGPAQTATNFAWGDENLWPSPTPTPTRTATPTPLTSATPTPSTTATPVPGCVGDCDGSGGVTVNELITMVNIALGNAQLSGCTAGDADGSGDITINEIIAGVNNALNGCPA